VDGSVVEAKILKIWMRFATAIPLTSNQ